MTNQTAEEIKTENIARMGEALGTQYSELWREVTILHVKWAEFIELFFTDKARTELLNRTASLHFRLTQDALWESIILHIARITDSSQSFGQFNLTIKNLPALISDANLKARITEQVNTASKECKFCLDWRHKIFAHQDLAVALEYPAAPVPSTSRKEVDAALKALADVLNTLEYHYKNGGTLFDLTPRRYGANALLSILQDALRARDEEIERLTRVSESRPRKLKARLPRGLSDRGPAEIAATRRMTDTIRKVYELYGFEPVETPAIEYTDALGKFLPDQDRPNEGVFSFQDDDEQWLSLRYDLTAPLARFVAENFDSLPKPYRSYRFGWVFRNEKPGPGRFRQFMQFDADTVGSASPAADAEICMMAADTMERLGFQRGEYVVKVNNRKVLDGVMEAIGIGGDGNAGKRLTVLRAIDKLDRLGAEGVKLLLGPGRKDESGDFTKGAELSEEQIQRLLTSYLGTSFREGQEASDVMTFGFWQDAVKGSTAGEAGVQELQEMCALCRNAGYESNRILFDSSVVRGLEYYTGPVYEVELLIETKDEKGRPVRFGSVGGGGRYDGLVSRFRGEPVPATGFSIGVSRLQAALTLIGKLDSKAEHGPVIVTVFDRDRIADYQKMVAILRNAGIRAELYLGNPKNFGNQLKYADRRNSPCAIIQGGDEKAKGEVQIKDLIEGAKAAAAIASNQEWRETRPAQFSCKEDELVEKVREVLARHGVK